MKQSTMDEALRSYLKRSSLEESSVEVLKRAVRWFVEMNDIAPENVTYGEVDDYQSWLSKGRAATTVNTYMAMIGGMFRWLRDRGKIQANPFGGVKRMSAAERHFETFETEEIGRILRVADLRWRAIVCLALCSMRCAEILNLHVSDVDFERNEVHIKPKIKSATTWKWSIKNHNEALVGIDESIARMLMELTENLNGPQPYVILKECYWKRNIEKQEAGKLSHYLRNRPWGNFTRDFQSLLKRAGVRPKRFHDLRGTFATERYRAGFSLVDLKYLMRHSSIQTTELYINRIETRELIQKSGRTFKKFYETKVP